LLEKQKSHRRQLHRQLTLVEPALEDKPASRRKVDELLEEIADLKGQLKAETAVVAEVSELLDTAEKEVQDRDRKLERLDMEAREGAVYKQKCEFLQTRNDCELARLQADLEYYQILADEFDSLEDIPSTDSTNADPAIVQKMRRQEGIIRRLRVEAGRGSALQDSLINNILMADMPSEKKKAIQAMISKFAEMKAELKLLAEKTKAHQRRQASASMKEKHTDSLKSNWEKQLASMEKALVATVRRYKEEKMENMMIVEDKDAEIARLNAYVKRMVEARDARNSTQFGRKPRNSRMISVSKLAGAAGTISALKSQGKRRKRQRKKSKSPEPVQQN